MTTSNTTTTGSSQGFDVQPSATQTITVNLGQQMPTVVYNATLNGSPVNVGWGVDHGNIGTVNVGPASSSTFTPTGTTGGAVNVIAGLNGMTLSRSVLVKLNATQNGADPNNPLEKTQIPVTVADLTKGGGVGGVGGEGLGPAAATGDVTALGMPVGNGSALSLKFLYPYDQTVWPRGLLAPLLQWSWSMGDADAIQIELSTTTGSFSYKGTFGKPAILAQTGGKFIRHPIPQDIWLAATNTAGGTDKLIVKLTVVKGGQAYGPISETWTIAPARLSGIIYYQSYGTKLAQNSPGAIGGNGMFGGAVLSIHGGDTGPQLVAGSNGAAAQCRVCHSVAANGSRLVVQHGDNYGAGSAYDLTNMGAVEHVMPAGISAFPAVYPDGSIALTPDDIVLNLPNGTAGAAPTGLPNLATSIGMPAFAPDGKHVAFNPMAGPIANPMQKLVVMGFDKATNAFSSPVVIADDSGQSANSRPGWPAFSPDGTTVIFQARTAPGFEDMNASDLRTREGALGHIERASASQSNTAVKLNALNGLDAMGATYLPKLPAPYNLSCTGDGYQVGNINADHSDDIDVNYEPTVNPVASGGYVWVVFTSRRMYGSVATIPSFCSDPRGVDLVQNITPKKLWVAALDLNATAGMDSSHPGFYLPAQEILAGNSRGFWSLDPCRQDGSSCDAGDECCNGYCEPNPQNQLVCANTPPNGMCSMVSDKCTTAADCCDSTNLCVNGFCTINNPM